MSSNAPTESVARRFRVHLSAMALLLLTNCAGDAPENRVRLVGRTNVLVGPTEVCIPPGMWLLVRKQNVACALRIVEVWSDGDATHAHVEIALPTGAGWKRRTMEVTEYPLVGPHPFSFQRGNVSISCDSFNVDYSRPSCISLYASGGDEIRDRVFAAPGAWSELSDVNPSEQGLTWYTVDDNRVETVELMRLPGGRMPYQPAPTTTNPPQ